MQESSEHESQVYDEQQSQQNANENAIKSQIVHPDNILQKLILDNSTLFANTDMFFSKIKQYNDIAVSLIEQKNNRQALIYLQQAERMLEYGAVRGKTIDRNLILCVLNNEAVSYQKQWIIQKAAKYIQALIYNIQVSIEQDNVPFQIIHNFDIEKEQNKQMCLSLIKRKNMLVKYYLIYCALMSQLKQNDVALDNSFKALAILKQMFAGYSKYYKSNAFREKDQRVYTAKKLRLLKQLSSYNEYLNAQNYQNLLKRTQYMLKEWKQSILEVKSDQVLERQVKDFSIANVMQPGALTYVDFDKKIDLINQISMLSLIKKVLLFTINFFSIATEIRLIDSHKNSTYQQKLKSSQFKKSQLYHLTAIKVFCTYIPYQSVLVKHIQNSYNNHYKHQLNVSKIQYIGDDQFQDENKYMDKEKEKDKKSMIDSEKNVVSYSIGEQYEEDVIKPIEKPVKKRKYVPMIEIPKSPKHTNTSKSKVSTNKKKTPRMMASPPLPSTRKKKQIDTLISPKHNSNKIISSNKINPYDIKSPKYKQKSTQRLKETSRNKKKSTIQRQKSNVKRDKSKSQTKIRKKSKSQTKMKSSKYSEHEFKQKTRY